MNWKAATDEQLMAIVKEDKDCPAQLLSGVVTEALERGLFENLYYWIFDNLTKNRKAALTSMGIDDEEIKSIGSCGVLNALRRWMPGKSSFKTFAYMNIRSEITHLMDQENARKREINKVTSSYDKETAFGVPMLWLLSEKTNVEKEVMRKIDWEMTMEPLTQYERDLIHLFLQGYSFKEINKSLNTKRKTNVAVKNEFLEALEKIGLGDFEIRVKKKKRPQQKVTPELVREIREAKLTFRTKQEEAEYYGISRRLIFDIRRNKRWREVI